MYLIDIATARNAVGSGDVKLRRMIGGRFKSHMAHQDKTFESLIKDGAPPRYEALRAVIDGGPFDPEHGFQYGYAYQMICQFHGTSLFNNDFSPYRGPWLQKVDAGLAQLGITAVELCEFERGSPPSPLPLPDLVPGYGEWSAEDCQAALAQWENSTPEQLATLNLDVREAIESCVDWLRAAQEQQRGIVGFAA